ncbi:hypothetical protein H1C71_038610, partial [Ictidomys tridecemlineatus]
MKESTSKLGTGGILQLDKRTFRTLGDWMLFPGDHEQDEEALYSTLLLEALARAIGQEKETRHISQRRTEAISIADDATPMSETPKTASPQPAKISFIALHKEQLILKGKQEDNPFVMASKILKTKLTR